MNWSVIQNMIMVGVITLVSANSTNAQPATPRAFPDIVVGVPALSADLAVTTVLNAPGGNFTQSQTAKYWRSRDGKARQDSGFSTVITDLTSRTITHINHQAKQATVIHMPLKGGEQREAPSISGGAPPIPLASSLPGDSIEGNLGEKIISGYRAIGTQVVRQGAGPMQSGSVTTEVWTAPDLRLPIYVRQIYSAGETVQLYENIRVEEQPASMFEVPAGYTVTQK